MFISDLRELVGSAAPGWFIFVSLTLYISVLATTDGRLANWWYPWWIKPPEFRGSDAGDRGYRASPEQIDARLKGGVLVVGVILIGLIMLYALR